MYAYNFLIHLHLTSVVMSISLFVLRYWWRFSGSPYATRRWARVVPHVIDSVLLLSGVSLVVVTGYMPFTANGSWLTEKLFGVIIYIVLGFIALGRRRPRSQQTGFIAFLLGLVVLYIIIKLAATKIPILG